MNCRSMLGAAAALCTAAGALAQPANDLCANAEAVAVPSMTMGTLIGATAESPAPPTCVTTYAGTPAVWYTVVGTGNTIQIDLCSSATSFDTKLHVYCNSSGAPCTSGFGCVTGNDDGASPCGTVSPIRLSKVTFCSILGQTYYVMVSTFSATTPLNDFILNVSDNGVACTTAVSCTIGACCSSSGACSITTASGCTGTSTFQGAGTSCTPTNPCTAQLRACCSSTGTCTLTMPAGCTGTSTFLAAETACTPTNPCTALLRACCSSTGTCSLTTPAGCAGATQTFLSMDTSCTVPANPCTALLGACCALSGSCTSTTAAGCTGLSVFQGVGTACTPTNPCPPAEACCLNSCCALITPARCATIGGTAQGPGSTCTVNPCTAVPSNDDCANAISTTVGTLVYGSNCGATPITSTELPAPTCQSSRSRSVWYTVTPATTGIYTISICGASVDLVLDVFITDCTSFTAVACDDDACAGGEIGPVGTGSGLASVIATVPLIGGQPYHIRIQSFGTTTSGFFQLLTSVNTTAGNCCNPTTGACTIVAAAASCAAPSVFTLGAVCTPNPCPQPTGACCKPDGTCSTETGADCVTLGGVFNLGVPCGMMGECPVAVGSCCNNTTGVCTYILASASCTGGTFTSGGVCSPNTCPQPGACCNAGCCTVTLAAACTGTWGPANSTCTPNPCGAPANDLCANAAPAMLGANPGSNCGATTDFSVDPSSLCGATTGAGGVRDVWYAFVPTQSAQYTFDTCATPGFDTVLALYGENTGPANACPTMGTDPVRACNDDDSTCTVSGLRSRLSNQLLVAGRTYFVRVAAWGGGTGEGPFILNITQGTAAGACCDGTSCSVTTLAGCTGSYQGDFSACGPGVCNPLGACCVYNRFGAFVSCTQEKEMNCQSTATAPKLWLMGQPCSACPATILLAGACCCGSTCAAGDNLSCTGTNQFFAGSGTVCNVFGVNNTTPCCFADYNQSGMVSVQDIFDYLAAYFAGDLCTDINNSGAPPSVQDIFDFLAAYFAGCP